MSHFEWENIDINAGNTVTGIISNIDYENLTADVTGVGVGLPIHYHCEEDAIEDTGKSYDVDYPDEQDEEGASAFSENDEVLVMYRRVNGEDPVIVGFVDEAMQCIGEYVLIKLYLTGKIHRCIVWNIRADRIASDVPLNHLEEDPEVFATFPCNPDDISNWLGKHVNVGEDLYSEWASVYQDGRDEGWLIRCDPPNGCPEDPPETAWWQTGVCSSSDEEDSVVPDKDGETIQDSYSHNLSRECIDDPLIFGPGASGLDSGNSIIQAFKRIAPPSPTNQGLFGSWKLGVMNFEEDKWTCVREKRIITLTESYNCYEYAASPSPGCTENIRVELIWETPLGILGSVVKDHYIHAIAEI